RPVPRPSLRLRPLFVEEVQGAVRARPRPGRGLRQAPAEGGGEGGSELRILVGGWFSLPRVGRDVFSLLMKQGVAYDKDLGFKFDSGTDIQAASRTVGAATGEEVELTLRCFVCVPGRTVIVGDNKQIRNSRAMDKSVGISGLCDVRETFSR